MLRIMEQNKKYRVMETGDAMDGGRLGCSLGKSGS